MEPKKEDGTRRQKIIGIDWRTWRKKKVEGKQEQEEEEGDRA